MAAMALPASIALPPPIPMTMSQVPRACCAPKRTLSTVGSPSTEKKWQIHLQRAGFRPHAQCGEGYVP